MRILSLGAGVQSSAVFLMACHGEMQIDHAIFGDTGWEPPAVYTWLADVLMPEAERAGIPIHVVQSHLGDVRDRWWEMPVFTLGDSGGRGGMVRRSCTSKFKVDPVRRKVRDLLGVGRHSRIAPGTVTQLLGISWDESQRMSGSPVKYIVNEYPLIDRRMTREDCQTWLEGHGYARAPRSACIGCPYHSDAEWLEMKNDRPDEFASAVALDERIRVAEQHGSLRDTPYLHRTHIPLREVRFKGEDDTPNGDCAGFCRT